MIHSLMELIKLTHDYGNETTAKIIELFIKLLYLYGLCNVTVRSGCSSPLGVCEYKINTLRTKY